MTGGDQFLTLTQAARRLGLSEPALRRRIQAGVLPVFTNPRDRRSRLIRLIDLDTYAVPTPVLPVGRENGSKEDAMYAAA